MSNMPGSPMEEEEEEPSYVIEGGRGDADDESQANKGKETKRCLTNPRQSASVLMQLKVIRKALERLLDEREQIKDILCKLRRTLLDMDNEIDVMTRMLEIGRNANGFQHGHY